MGKISFLGNKTRLYTTFMAQAFSYFSRGRKVYSPPLVLNLEPTNSCPMKCVMCPRQYMKRKVGFMDFELFKKIMDQVRVYHKYIELLHFGDPLMHPRIFDFVDYCHSRGIKVYFSVNPTLLTPKVAEKMVSSGVDHLYIALDSFDDASYKKVRGSNADYAKAVANIKYLAGLKVRKNAKKPVLELGLIYMELTKDRVDEFRKTWDIPGVDGVVIKQFCAFGIDPLQGLADESTLKMIKGRHNYPCFIPWHYLTILWDGRVVPCCYDYDGKHVLGDLKKESLDSIWNGVKMRELRQQHISGNFQGNNMCADCREGYGWPSFNEPVKLSYYSFRKLSRVLSSKLKGRESYSKF